MAGLAGVFIAEGLYAYLVQRQQYVTGVVWIAIGLTLALVSSRGRVEQWRWAGHGGARGRVHRRGPVRVPGAAPAVRDGRGLDRDRADARPGLQPRAGGAVALGRAWRGSRACSSPRACTRTWCSASST